MSRITEIKITPQVAYVGDQVLIQVKAESIISWQELKDNFTWNTLKDYKFKDIGGNN